MANARRVRNMTNHPASFPPRQRPGKSGGGLFLGKQTCSTIEAQEEGIRRHFPTSRVVDQLLGFSKRTR
jgi:hypothetical protein